jgi:lysophospholipase L1-like esterase
MAYRGFSSTINDMGTCFPLINRLLKNVMSAGKTRQNSAKKRSLWLINEHFESDFNAVWPSAIVFQLPVKWLVSIGICIAIVSTPTETIAQCRGDFDGDRDVDGSNVAVFAQDFGRMDCSAGPPCEGDIHPLGAPDGDVDEEDLMVFLLDFSRSDCPVRPPLNMFNIGDSIGEGEAADDTIGEAHHGIVWSTGFNISDIVNSFNERFEENDPVAYFENNESRDTIFNRAVSGDRMSDFAAQASQVVNAAALTPSGKAGLVTVLLGNNDVCADDFSTMTDPLQFEAQYRAGLDILTGSDATQSADIHVSGIPAIYWLWEAKSDAGGCRFIWWLGGICQVLLQHPADDCESIASRNNPDSDFPNDGDNCLRRKAFHRTIRDSYNAILRDVLQEYIDDGRLPNAQYVDVFDVRFDANQVNNGDCFHPSVDGHALLADEAWIGSKWSPVELPFSP